MRVTRSMLNSGLDRNLSKAINDLDNIQSRMATGRDFLQISEAPAKAIMAVGIRRTLQAEEQYKSNMSNVRTTLVDGEMALNEMNDIVQSALDISSKGATGTLSPEDRQIMAEKVQRLMDRLVSAGNTQSVGQYVFSGYATDQPPFTVVGNELHYNGQPLNTGTFTADSQEIRYIDVGRGLEMQAAGPKSGTAFAMNTPGCDIIGTGTDNLYNVLNDLKTALDTDNSAGVLATTSRLEDCHDRVLYGMASFGERQNYVDTELERYSTLEVNRKDQLSKIEDIDLAKGSVEMAKRQMAYSVLLHMGGQMQMPTLADFLS